MLRLSTKLSVLAIVVTILLLFYFQSFKKPALPETTSTYSLKQETVATATAPPKLVSAILGGKQVYVLYVTQADDTVLVRCYPTYEPTITVRAMGNNSDTNTQKEGVMTCRSSS
ncbi:hypothetical protein [Myxosarcina sp. GI1]|uniref:hypothetical protein n=1 Tax=Myxosarcina sp. GI1 TaxID=1541065 RepID=UPI00068F2682|nr:hypothetical protein [Myxosarcina sp. GI1]